MDLAFLIQRVAGFDAFRDEARRASSIASGHAPPSCMTSARWIRHAPANGTSCG
jgi:hypothetical protein